MVSGECEWSLGSSLTLRVSMQPIPTRSVSEDDLKASGRIACDHSPLTYSPLTFMGLFPLLLLLIQPKQIDQAVAGAGGQVASVDRDADAIHAGGGQLPLPAFLLRGQVPENDPAAVASRGEGF